MSYIFLKDGQKIEFNEMEMMGIINVTPDSFFGGSRVRGIDEAVSKAGQMIAEGATILDVGGESTRPGAESISPEVEAGRVCPVISSIKERYPKVLISVDTYNASTAHAAIRAGADIVNDISGMTFDEDMVKVVASEKVPVVLCHTGGRPDVMQKDPHYDDVVEEVYRFLEGQIEFGEAHGIQRDRILVDVGIGFGKTYEHNITLLKNIDRFSGLGCPMVLAVSRKTFIGQALGQDDPADRLCGTIALTLYGRMHGAEIARVHDVGPNMSAVRMLHALDSAATGHGLAGREERGSRGKAYKAAIALGSNMGDREQYIELALFDIERQCGKILAKSDIIETAAYGKEDQPDFLNGAVIVETRLSPMELLRALQTIELELGRVRTIHWGPRTIDLDIIYFDRMIIDEKDLKVPHPDRCNRDFVLGPIAQIAPELVDPVEQKTVAQLHRELMERSN